LDLFWQEIRYGLRSFRRQPWLIAAVVLSLAVGIGTNAIIFSVLNSVLLHPASTRAWNEPDRVLTLWETNHNLSSFFANQLPVRPPNFRAWKEQNEVFQTLAAWRSSQVNLFEKNRAGRPSKTEIGEATADLFSLLDIHPELGRLFSDADTKGERSNVAVISDELYRSRFHSDPHVLGSLLETSNGAWTVVGVLPPALAMPAIWGGLEKKKPLLWIPLSLSPSKRDEESSLFVFGRLKPGKSVATARAQMHVVESRLSRTPLEEDGFGINVMTLLDSSTDASTQRAIWVLQFAVGFVLLIACANAGNLLLTRSAARDKEMAIRSAIGAGRFRLLRQLLIEGLLMSSAAAVVGLLLTLGGVRLCAMLAPKDLSLQDLDIDQFVLLFTLGLTVLTGVVFGLIPAYYSWTSDLNSVLGRGGRGIARSNSAVRNMLVVCEIACCLVLVTGAGLMIRSLHVLMSTDLGFRTDHLLVVRLALPDDIYKTPELIRDFNEKLLQTTRSVPGIEASALTTAAPMKAVSQSNFEIVGRPKQKGQLPVTDWARVSDRYFDALRLPVLEGRAFGPEEIRVPEPSVAVVNRKFANEFFPNENALGQSIKFGNENGHETAYRIVGVVGNEHQMGPDHPEVAELYLPGDHLNNFLLVARTLGDPTSQIDALKRSIWQLDKDLVISDAMTEENALVEWSAPRRFNERVLIGFATVAIFLAALGLYSVLAYAVTMRRREFGIRVALGAAPASISSSVVGGGLRLAVVGVTIGLVLSFVLTRYMSSLIVGVSANDPGTLSVVVLGILVISVAACVLPAWRASRVDPVEALRAE
jgi:putative ABC transport system permease protein